ncbi:nonstructural protein 1 [Galliform chaphamaparvovirus 13]|nr:nonstructural protein 1 [Galliform chaphamaparvovirus 13]
MQSQMASSGTSYGILLWVGSKGCAGDFGTRQQAQAHLVEKEFVLTPMPEVEKFLKLCNMKTWLCCIIQISGSDGQPLYDPLAYAMFLQNLKEVSDWACTGEFNPDQIFHVHVMLKSNQRSDAARRSMLTAFDNLKLTDIWTTCFGQDTTMDVLKLQQCHRPQSMLEYFMKDPCWALSNNEQILQTMYDIDCWEMSARFRTKEPPRQSEMNEMTETIISTIRTGQCKTIADVMRQNPEALGKYLHRPGLSAVINNCLTFVEATGGDWNLALYDVHDPNPEPIHKILLFQGIEPTKFDTAFHTWITKKDPKINTLVLIGPSNTGKSQFISGLKACVSWGEIVNGQSFNFEGLIGNTLGVWEEPLIGPELAEKCKQIFEGMPTAINVKYKRPHTLPRTPIIMTTNHHPWRFCQAEEDMFKNRMYIFQFSHCAKDATYVPRACEPSCKCRYCQASRGCSPSIGESEPCTVQRANQPLSTGEQWTIWSHTGAVIRTGSLPGTREGTSGSHYSSSGCSGTGTEECSTHSSGPPISTSTTTIQHMGRERHGSGDSDLGIPSTSAHAQQLLESRQSGRCASSYSHGTRGDSTRQYKRQRGRRTDGDNKRKYGILSFMEPMGSQTQKAQTFSVQAKQQRLDRSMGSRVGSISLPMYVPLKGDWEEYLSYLYHLYG